MPEVRVQCISPGCPNTILPSTARRTGGYCGPCDGKRRRAEHDEYVRRNHREVDSYAGVTDSVELIRLALQPRRLDPLISYRPPPRSLEELFAGLDADQGSQLMKIAAQSYRARDREFAHALARLLAAFTDFVLDPMLEVWIELNEYWPPISFRRAGTGIRDRVLSALQSGTASPDHALQAAAWIGDQTVAEALVQFETNPSHWVESLYLSPTAYARTAGWEVVNGTRRNLTLQTCMAILALPSTVKASEVHIGEAREERCPWCHLPLINLLRLSSASRPVPFLTESGTAFRVITCERCTCFGFVFAELDANGHGHWSTRNTRPNLLPADAPEWSSNPWRGVSLDLVPRSAFHAAEDSLPTTLSQIGGFPAWVQDVGFPNCCRCDKTMLFIAQIDNGHFPGHEGIYYAFLCPDCRVTATSYQQT